MELYIYSPAYFTNMYGIDDEVYKYCQMLHQNGASFNAEKIVINGQNVVFD